MLPTILALLLTTTSGGDPLDAPLEGAPVPAVTETAPAASSTWPTKAQQPEDPARIAMLRARKRAYLEAKLDEARVFATEKKLESAALLTGGIAIPVGTFATAAALAIARPVGGNGGFGVPGPATPLTIVAAATLAAGCTSTCALAPCFLLGGLTSLNNVDEAEANVIAREAAIAKLDALPPPSTGDVRY